MDNRNDVGNNDNNNYVDTTNVTNPVWLMKCPTVVARSLQSPTIPNEFPVAKVILSVDPLCNNKDESTKFTMELSGSDLGNVPKRFSMETSKGFAPMFVFSESQGKFSIDGKILNKFDMKPQYDKIDSYGKLCRERTKKSMTKTRQIQVIGNDRPITPMPGITNFQEKKKVVVKATETKRTRRDRGEMEDLMFKLFEQQPNWTLKELVQKTDQPEQFMKDILKDLCVYNNKGSHQGSYELKPEYKKSVDDATGS